MRAGPADSTDGDRWTVNFIAMFGELGYSADEIRRVAPHVVAEHRAANLWTEPTPGAADGLAALRAAGYVVGCVSNADGTVDKLLAGAGLA
jgi:phosphoglycolate phosphatase-like HAD superfamily hydrolase